MTCIKVAVKEDLPEIFEVFKQGISELEYPIREVEDSVLKDSIEKTWRIAPCFIVVKEDKIIGIASLNLISMPWSAKPILTSNIVHVLKEYRNFAIIKQLYKTIRGYAELQGIPYLDQFMGTEKSDARARLARTQKLENVGITILYNGVDNGICR